MSPPSTMTVSAVITCLVLTVAPALGHPPSDTLLAKCCPAGQQLAMDLKGCVPYHDVLEGVPTSGSETVGSLRSRTSDFPWWLDPSTPVYNNTNSSEVVEYFLAGQQENFLVESGVFPLCKFYDTVVISPRKRSQYKLFLNGSLAMKLTSKTKLDPSPFVVLDSGEFCSDRVAVTTGGPPIFVFLACPCAKALCINKCCSPRKLDVVRESRMQVNSECVMNDVKGLRTWQPTFYEEAPANESTTKDVAYVLIGGKFPACEDGSKEVSLNVEPTETPTRFWLLVNGSAAVERFNHGFVYPRDAYCADWLQRDDGRVVENLVFCAATRGDAPVTATRVLYGALYIVTAVFLVLTVAVYWLLPELRATPHGKALMCHAAALFLACVPSAHGQIHDSMSAPMCFTTAFVVQFSFLAAFFWLNVMCVDISWAFGGFRALPGSIAERDRRKFLFYSLYAWGCPTLICGVTALIEFTDGLPDSLIRPDIGVKTCWFFTKSATLLYFYGPMAVLLLMNVGLFAFTMWRIVQVHRDTEMLHRGESMRHQGNSSSAFASNRERFILYVKLFCLMGVTWITEFISWAEGSETILWYVTDFINLLRGVFIFVIFCCKPKVLRLVRRRLHDGWASLARACGCGGEGGNGVGRSRATSIWWGSLTSDPSNKSSGPTATSTCQTSVRMTEVNGSAARKDSKPAQETEER